MDTQETIHGRNRGTQPGRVLVPRPLFIKIRYQVESLRVTGHNEVTGKAIWSVFNVSAPFDCYRDAKLHSRDIRSKTIKARVQYTDETRAALEAFDHEKTITPS